jgi:hypothetical protein
MRKGDLLMTIRSDDVSGGYANHKGHASCKMAVAVGEAYAVAESAFVTCVAIQA